MPGLPKKIIKKYGFTKRAWREFRKTKRSKPKRTKAVSMARTKRKSASRKRKTGRIRTRIQTIVRRVRSSRPAAFSRRSFQGMAGSTTRAAISTGIGVAGAVGSAALVNAMPITDARAKALAQLGIGLGLLAFLGPRNANIRLAAAGSSLAGALALVRASGAPLPLLAGCDVTGPMMGLNYYPGISGRYGTRRLLTEPAKSAAPATMGINIHKGGMSGSGYGGKFLTQADM